MKREFRFYCNPDEDKNEGEETEKEVNPEEGVPEKPTKG